MATRSIGLRGRWRRGWAACALAVLALTSRPTRGVEDKPDWQIPLASIPTISPGLEFRPAPTLPWKPARPDTPLHIGSELKTADQPQTVVLRGGTVVELDVGSVIVLQPPLELQIGGGVRPASRVDLKSGAMMARLAKESPRALVIMGGPELFAAFESGRAVARKVAKGMIVATYQQPAMVAVGGLFRPLGPFQKEFLPNDGKRRGPQPLAPAPALDGSDCVARGARSCAMAVTSDEPKRLGIAWTSLGPDFGYRVFVARTQDLSDVVQDVQLAPGVTRFVSQPLPVGNYWLAAQSVSPEKIEGHVSVRRGRVVGLRGAQGAFVLAQRGEAVLPPGRDIRVLEPEGLEVSFNGGRWGPAPPSVGLGSNRTTRSVQIRLASVPTDSAAIELFASTLNARVWFSPQTARWPADPVTLEVRVQDPSGRALPSSVRPRVRVTLNLAKINVPMRSVGGGRWKGAIPFRSGPGPWVLRATAHDQYDNELGRGFLEIEGNRSTPAGAWQWW